MRSFIVKTSVIVLVVQSLALSGCSAWMAATAPRQRDMGVLTPGVPRTRLVAELGEPLSSKTTESGPRDLFAFKQGYSRGALVGRTSLHLLADAMTIGFWEIVGVPLESSMRGEDVRAQVDYDDQDRVSRVRYFAGGHLRHGQPALASWMRGRKTEQATVVDDRTGDEMPFDSLIIQKNTFIEQRLQQNTLVQQRATIVNPGGAPMLPDESLPAGDGPEGADGILPVSGSVRLE